MTSLAETQEQRWTIPLGAEALARARAADVERRVARLDAHSAEMAKELLDVIGRLDGLAERVQGSEATVARERGLSFAHEDDTSEVLQRLADLEHSDLEDRLGARIERITERLGGAIDRLDRRVDHIEGDAWRAGQGR